MKGKITKKTVEALVPGQRDRFFFDTELKGFGVKVTPKGRRVYVVQYWKNGASRRQTIGPHGVLTAHQARERAAKIKLQVADGLDPAVEKQEQKLRERNAHQFEFQQVVTEFINVDQKPGNRTWETVQRRLEMHVVPRWGKFDIRTITHQQVRDLLKDLEAEGLTAGANRVLAHVRRLFNWAIEEGKIEASPALRIKRLSVERARDRVLLAPEICVLWRASGELGYPFGSLFRLLLLTAQRRSEVANMQWHDLDFETGIWDLSAAATKSDRAHLVPLSTAAVEIIAGIERGNRGDYVLSTTGGKRPVSGFSDAKRRLMRIITAANDDLVFENSDWRVHDLRRTAATGIVASGVPHDTLARVLNHARHDTTSVYNRYGYLEEKRAALETWARRLNAIVAPATDNVVELRKG